MSTQFQAPFDLIGTFMNRQSGVCLSIKQLVSKMQAIILYLCCTCITFK